MGDGPCSVQEIGNLDRPRVVGVLPGGGCGNPDLVPAGLDAAVAGDDLQGVGAAANTENRRG